MTDEPEDANYVVLGHVVCGRICYEEFEPRQMRLWYGQLELPLRLDPG